MPLGAPPRLFDGVSAGAQQLYDGKRYDGEMRRIAFASLK
jgi:hypothetical protein